MSTNSSILGDSWVVEAAASPSPKKHPHPTNSQPSRATTDHTKKVPSPRETRASDHDSASVATASASGSFSGPELIMPSIYETPVDGSWVAPNVRSRQKHGQQGQRRRHQHQPPGTSPKDQKSPSHRDGARNQASEADQPRDPHHDKDPTKSAPSLLTRLEPSLRTLLNALLLASITHLLILPELITQHQSFFCTIPVLSSLYPTSCTAPSPFTVPSPQHLTTSPARTHEQKLALHATSLERLFTSTLTTLSPLPPLLKQSDARLRALHSDLSSAFPGSRNELALEFSGLWESWRSGSRKFDSLRADLRSAVDNLIATSISSSASSADGDGGHASNEKARGGNQEKAQARAAQISSAQLSRRAAYLDQLTSRMQGKAEALSTDLATVEDHLESIERIIMREHHPSSSSSSSHSTSDTIEKTEGEREGGGGWLSQVLGLGGARQERRTLGRSEREALVVAATGHRAVAEAVRNLSQRLEAVQRRKIA
ncbi:hypothetical protein P170DRAFT_425840 [Aspergillus steynii IBT 23096]|uniref:Uncharacterized protein n=1 Tax=Aspergillus steynii IBT 23096 TaxID=1392250 RepID=A0A2I2G7H7_9EURO|nr:uncharacterized protein P170DRAFT_425840 [Aspergillus steynii IBT 23096]PLB48832.1 hypothetical protein P170DRAFT_425840 [Aspergillus steynii IBT 23096]